MTVTITTRRMHAHQRATDDRAVGLVDVKPNPALYNHVCPLPTPALDLSGNANHATRQARCSTALLLIYI